MRKAAEVAATALGDGLDVAGAGYERLPAADIESIVTHYPRLGFKPVACARMIEQCERKPFAYLLHLWAEVGRRHIEGFSVPTAEDLTLAAPFRE